MVAVSLDAVLVAVTDETPKALVVPGRPDGLRFPAGGLEPTDRTLELAMRRVLREQTGLEAGYAEQLYSFGDLGRIPEEPARMVSVAYLLLGAEEQPRPPARWVGWYDLLPWEDHRQGRPPEIDGTIADHCRRWVAGARDAVPRSGSDRNGPRWSSGSTARRGTASGSSSGTSCCTSWACWPRPPARDGLASQALELDHRRMAATALGRLRGKLTYRPVVFELLPATFTLLQLQRLVEALAGVRLHKQNFRRLVDSQGLVEGTGRVAQTGGRPAELFRFRREVVRERPRPGVGTPWTGAGINT